MDRHDLKPVHHDLMNYAVEIDVVDAVGLAVLVAEEWSRRPRRADAAHAVALAVLDRLDEYAHVCMHTDREKRSKWIRRRDETYSKLHEAA